MTTNRQTFELLLGALRLWLALLAATLLAGCATAPVEQIKYFSQAFNTVNTLGQPLLDDLALAERTQGQQIAVRRAQNKSRVGIDECPPGEFPWVEAASGKQGIIRGFCLRDAAYFSVLSDPPATASMRGALLVIERYADVLSALAEGRNVEGAVGQLDALAKNVTGLLGIAGEIAPALSALQPILESAAKQANAAEAKRLILEGAPKVTALIAALRRAVPAMFKTLIEAPDARLTSAAASDPALAAVDVVRIDAYRTTVANYVVLLGKMQTAWDLTVAAANSPPGVGRLAALIQQTAELKGDAEAARKALAILRSGGAPAPGR